MRRGGNIDAWVRKAAAALLLGAASAAAAATDQTITFSALSNRTYGGGNFTLSATASSGLPPAFSVSSGAAVVTGNTVTPTGSGSVTIVAAQAGNGSYNPAPDVSQTLTVYKALVGEATGGTITRDGDYLVHKFTGNGTFSVPGPVFVTAEILAVGGGGGGHEGGGGAGGFKLSAGNTLVSGNYTVTVGAGGGAGAGGTAAGSGANSSFSTLIAYGGGGGGGYVVNAAAGASGGGARLDRDGAGGAASYGDQGYAGGGSHGAPAFSAGGGGGAGGPGGEGTNLGGDFEGEFQYPDGPGGNGGAGRSSGITGSSVFYGGGGGGTNYSGGGATPTGGTGGGGAGSVGNATGTAGTNALGGGGGAHAAGGSGVVVVRYFSPLPDTTAPTAPSSLAAANSGSPPISVNLSWTGSTDEFGAVVYDIYRTKSGVTNLAFTTSSTSFNDAHVLPATAYSYTVKARDAAGNISSASNSASVTTSSVADTTPANGIPDGIETLFYSSGTPTLTTGDLGLNVHRPQ